MNERLKALRKKMKEAGIDLYIVPTDDFHLSEYVGDHFKCRAYLTGFTGSAGTAVVTQKEACLWTDGRYFLQAKDQLKESGFSLMKMGVEGVPRVVEYVEKALPESGVIGFDGRCISAEDGLRYNDIAMEKNGAVVTDVDLVGDIWENRPEMSREKAWALDLSYAGEDVRSKLSRIRKEMEDSGADLHVLSSLDDIAWVLNLRGNDVKHCPVILSYLIIDFKMAYFYVQDGVLSGEIRDSLLACGVEIRPYGDIFKDCERISGEVHQILVDPARVSDRLLRALTKHAESEESFILEAKNPSTYMKAVKNPVEVENIRKAHIKDGVVLCKWLYWLKHALGKEKLTELSVARKLDEMRTGVDTSLGISFETIAGYGANGAIIHYGPTEESDKTIEEKSFLLVDSGGHYLEGTTDVTRTVACGPLTEKEKEYFTLVLKGHLNLANVQFLSGCTGVSLDYVAREPLWRKGLDYRHGTGHGIGYLLSVHEGPNGFRYRIVPERNDCVAFVPGMVTSDEPGVYVENEFGIRHESVLICEEAEKNEYGQFYRFRNVTMCPIDLSAVEPALLADAEKEALNEYHQTVYETVSPYLTEEEADWLRIETRRI